jgi:hypothetical protein
MYDYLMPNRHKARAALIGFLAWYGRWKQLKKKGDLPGNGLDRRL